jgi:hypothetical protein
MPLHDKHIIFVQPIFLDNNIVFIQEYNLIISYLRKWNTPADLRKFDDRLHEEHEH